MSLRRVLLRTIDLTIIFALASPCICNANWIPLGPPGGQTDELISDPVRPDILWAVDSDAIWKTTDRGASWLRAPTPLNTRVVQISPSNPSVMYAGGEGGISRSLDGGFVWNAPRSARSPNEEVFDLAVHPTSPDTVYGATSDGLFRSSDGGASWENIGERLGDYLFDLVRLSPGNPAIVFAGTAGGGYSAGPGGLFQSSNGGKDWVRISTAEMGEFVYALIVAPQDPSILYVATDIGVFRSQNGGATWAAASSGITFGYNALQTDLLAGDPADPNLLYAGTAFGVFVSRDGAHTWKNVGQIEGGVTALAVDGKSVAYASSSVQGIVRSSDRGTSWTTANGNRARVTITAIRVGPTGSVYAVSAAGVLKLATDGQWIRLSNGFPELLDIFGIVPDLADANILYAETNDYVYRSVDGGSSWMPERTGISDNNIFCLVIDSQSPNTLYAGALDDGVFKTTDAGMHWAHLAGSPPGVFDIAIDPANSSLLYAATESSGVFKSVDGGQTWLPINNGLAGVVEIWRIAINPTNPSIICIAVASGFRSPGMFRTTDSGATWSRVVLGDGVNVYDLAADSSGVMYAATGERGLLRSTDGGATWMPLNGGPAGIDSVAIAANRVYVGTFRESAFAVMTGSPRRRAVR